MQFEIRVHDGFINITFKMHALNLPSFLCRNWSWCARDTKTRRPEALWSVLTSILMSRCYRIPRTYLEYRISLKPILERKKKLLQHKIRIHLITDRKNIFHLYVLWDFLVKYCFIFFSRCPENPPKPCFGYMGFSPCGLEDNRFYSSDRELGVGVWWQKLHGNHFGPL